MATYYLDATAGSDANLGTSPGAGNAWQTLGKATSTAAAGDTVHIKANGSYVLTAAAALSNSGTVASGPITYQGYTTTPGADDGRPVITTATDSVNLVNLNGKGQVVFRHLKFTSTATTRLAGIIALTAAPGPAIVTDCVFDGLLYGIRAGNIGSEFGAALIVEDCEFLNCTSRGLSVAGASVTNCHVHANSIGVEVGPAGSSTSGWMGTTLADCRVVANTSQGVLVTASGTVQTYLNVRNCTVAGNTSDGIKSSATGAVSALSVENCLIYGNGGWGVLVSGNSPAYRAHHNALGSNTSGGYSGVAAGSGDVSLSADPFTNSAGGDYSLNSTAGGGAACRGAGSPAYRDIGALQHQDAGAAAGMLYLPNLDGV